MKPYRPKRTSLLHRICLFACLALIACGAIAMPGTVAKYRSQASANDSAKVAQFVLDSDFEIQSRSFQLTGLSPTAGEKTFTFDVTNNKDGKVSEVAMKYTVEIKGLGNLPLIYTVSNGTATQTKASPVSVSNFVEANTGTTHTYTVTVGWNPDDSTNKDAKYTEEIDLVTVTLTCEQID